PSHKSFLRFSETGGPVLDHLSASSARILDRHDEQEALTIARHRPAVALVVSVRHPVLEQFFGHTNVESGAARTNGGGVERFILPLINDRLAVAAPGRYGSARRRHLPFAARFRKRLDEDFVAS